MRNMKKYFGPVFLIASVIIAITLIRNKPTAEIKEVEKNIPFVKTMILKSQKVKARISSQGFIRPKSELNILSELNARVEWISSKMEPGSSFNEGDTLIKLDKRDYELALITAEANVLNANVNLEREKAESDIASKEWKRVGGGSGTDLALRKPQLAQAKATLEAAKAELERTKRNLDRTVFVAPFKGRVRSKNTDMNSIVFPGTMLGSIYATQYFEVQLPITDQDVKFTGLSFNGLEIPDNKQLDVTFTIGDNILNGKVIRAEAEVDPKTRMLSVVASIAEKNNDNKNLILVGQYIQATIFGMEMDNIFLLPRNNVRNESVWVVNSQMELTNRAVDIVRFEGEFALIGEGIEKGDRLLKSRLSSLINGQKVTYTLK